VAQIMEAQWRPAVLVEPGGVGGALEHPLGDDALAASHRLRMLLGLELIDRVDCDSAVAAGVADDAVKGRQGVGGGLWRAALAAKLEQQLGDRVDCDRGDAAGGERRQQVALELVAVGLEGAQLDASYSPDMGENTETPRFAAGFRWS
jgi:hypothetical protein